MRITKALSFLMISFALIGGLVLIDHKQSKSSEILDIKTALAESECPAPVPSSSVIIRSGSDNGPILGQYSNGGWNEETGSESPTYASLSVPSGTVLYFSTSTSGVESTNRTQGSEPYYFGGGVTLTGGRPGYYQSGYSFTRQALAVGFSDPLTGAISLGIQGRNSCWGGFDDGVTIIRVQVSVGGVGPGGLTIRSASTNLAVIKDPTVSLLVNGQPSANVPSGATPNLTWATNSVNAGNSCTATNTNSDSNWNGTKNGPGGGSQVIGPMNNSETFTYTIVCNGFNGRTAQDEVQITVDDAPSYTCSINPPGVQSMPRGSNRSATLRVNPSNGYNSSVEFNTASVVPINGTPPGTPPVVTIAGSPQSSPYSSPSVVTIQSNVNPPTTPGSYRINMTGTGGVACPPILVNVTSNPGTIDIKFNNSDGPVSLTPPTNSGQLTWVPNGDVASCTASMLSGNYPAWSGNRNPNGNQNVTNLQPNSSYVFKIDCISDFGEQVEPDTVGVNVGNPPLEPTTSIKCKGTNPVNPTFVNGPCIVNSGDSGMVETTVSGAASCTLTPPIPGYNIPLNGRGETSTPAIFAPGRTYELVCRNSAGTESQPKTVRFELSIPPAEPFIDIKCKGTNPPNPTFVNGTCRVNPGDTAQLQLETRNVTTCSLSPAINGYSAPVNNTTTVFTPPIPGPSSVTYRLSCTSPPGTNPIPDQVTIEVVQPDPDFSIECASVPMEQSDTKFINLQIIPSNGFNSQVSFSHAITAGGPSRPTVTDPGPINPASNPPSSQWAPARVVTGPFTTPTTFTVRFTVSGGTKTHSKDCYVIVEEVPPPETPTISTNNRPCDQVTVSYGMPEGKPEPERYELYAGTRSNGPLLQTTNTPNPPPFDPTYSFTHRYPAALVNGIQYHVYAYSRGKESFNSALGTVIRCEPNLTGSDKDIKEVRGRISKQYVVGRDYQICNPTDVATLPNGALFSSGDVITFEIHVCNRGEGPANNVKVIDKLYSTNNAETQGNLIEPRYISSSQNCAAVGQITADTIEFTIANIPAGNNICTITFTAKLKKITVPGTRIHRFQNTGTIIVPEFPHRNTTYTTPPYLFSVTGVPDRDETAPLSN